jgi:hypothetical protein
MAVLFAVFVVILSGCVIALMVIALAAIFGSLRDIGRLKRVDRGRRREIQ